MVVALVDFPKNCCCYCHNPCQFWHCNKEYQAGWWFGTWLLFSLVLGIIPIDELIFFRGAQYETAIVVEYGLTMFNPEKWCFNGASMGFVFMKFIQQKWNHQPARISIRSSRIHHASLEAPARRILPRPCNAPQRRAARGLRVTGLMVGSAGDFLKVVRYRWYNHSENWCEIYWFIDL